MSKEKQMLAGFSKDPTRRAQLLRAVQDEIRAVIQEDPTAEPRVTVSDLIPQLQALEVDPWPEMDPISEAANYGRTIGAMLRVMPELSVLKASHRKKAPLRIGVTEGEPVVEVPEPTTVRPLVGVLFKNMDDVDPTFNTPKAIEMRELDLQTLQFIRDTFGPDDAMVALGLFGALQDYDPDFYTSDPVGRKRSDHIFQQLKDRGLVKLNPFKGNYSMVPEKPEDVVVIRRADLDELPADLELLRMLFEKAPGSFFKNLVRVLRTQGKIIEMALNAVPPEARDELQQRIASSASWIDEFYKD